jgi:hypothetical protein
MAGLMLLVWLIWLGARRVIRPQKGVQQEGITRS